MIGRRNFITLLGGTAATWPLAARAQQPAMPVVGFLSNLGRDDRPNLRGCVPPRLGRSGYIEGRNVTIEYRFADNQPDRLPALAADLVDRKVAVIAATGGGRAVLAAKASTTTIPIVFTFGGDPVREGFVASLNRPGGNITGVTFWYAVLRRQKAGAAARAHSQCSRHRTICDTRDNRECEQVASDAREAARTLGRQLLVLDAGTPSEIDTAFATLRQQRAGALLVAGSPFFTSRRQQIVTLAARDAIPGDVLQPRICRGGRADELWQRRCRPVSPSRTLRRTDSQRRETSRPAGRSGHQVRVCDQSQDRQGARLDVPPELSARADEVIE